MNLWQKIHAVMSESESLEKKMTVGEGKNSYKAVGEAEVLNNVKPLLKKYNLICLPTDGEISEVSGIVETEYNGVKKVSARNVSQLKAYFKLIDAETGESVQIVGFGYGADSQDKGAGKASTYAYKNALSKSFMLFSGEDTDNDHSDEIGKPKADKPTSTQPKAEKPTPKPAQPKPEAGKPQQDVTAKKEETAVKPNPFVTPHHICEDCQKEITDHKNSKGVIYSVADIIQGSTAEYNKKLCYDCASKRFKARQAELRQQAKKAD